MISYNLAKKLEKAGFPQKPKSEFPLYICEDDKKPMQIPTLSELIESCGKGFGQLEKTDNNWKCIPAGSYMFSLDWIAGKSPEEVVAKLWLKLNKK